MRLNKQVRAQNSCLQELVIAGYLPPKLRGNRYLRSGFTHTQKANQNNYLKDVGSKADGNFVEARLDGLSQLLPIKVKMK